MPSLWCATNHEWRFCGWTFFPIDLLSRWERTPIVWNPRYIFRRLRRIHLIYRAGADTHKLAWRSPSWSGPWKHRYSFSDVPLPGTDICGHHPICSSTIESTFRWSDTSGAVVVQFFWKGATFFMPFHKVKCNSVKDVRAPWVVIACHPCGFCPLRCLNLSIKHGSGGIIVGIILHGEKWRHGAKRWEREAWKLVCI